MESCPAIWNSPFRKESCPAILFLSTWMTAIGDESCGKQPLGLALTRRIERVLITVTFTSWKKPAFVTTQKVLTHPHLTLELGTWKRSSPFQVFLMLSQYYSFELHTSVSASVCFLPEKLKQI